MIPKALSTQRIYRTVLALWAYREADHPHLLSGQHPPQDLLLALGQDHLTSRGCPYPLQTLTVPYQIRRPQQRSLDMNRINDTLRKVLPFLKGPLRPVQFLQRQTAARTLLLPRTVNTLVLPALTPLSLPAIVQ